MPTIPTYDSGAVPERRAPQLVTPRVEEARTAASYRATGTILGAASGKGPYGYWG